MTTRGLRLTAVVSACTLGLVLTACGDDQEQNESGGGRSDYGPLAEFMGWDRDYDSSDMSEEERQKQYRVEELVAECMAELGFEYIPQRYDDQMWGVDPVYKEIWALQEEDPERFAREYGYGMSTMPEDETSDEETYEDPNWEIREGLSPSAQEEYDKALWGEWPEYEEGEEPEGPVEPETPGCYSEATDEVYGFDEEDFSQWEDLEQQFSELYERIENDPRVKEATQAWIDCMAEAGYPGLEDIYGGHELVNDRMSEVYGWGDIEEGEDLEILPSAPAEPDPAALAELQDYERAVALADYQCRRDHYDSVYNSVRDDLETQFIDDHRTELEAYRDFLNERYGTNG